MRSTTPTLTYYATASTERQRKAGPFRCRIPASPIAALHRAAAAARARADRAQTPVAAGGKINPPLDGPRPQANRVSCSTASAMRRRCGELIDGGVCAKDLRPRPPWQTATEDSPVPLPAPPRQQAASGDHQARQASADDGAGDGSWDGTTIVQVPEGPLACSTGIPNKGQEWQAFWTKSGPRLCGCRWESFGGGIRI